jgi:hypothetical protein
MEIALRCGVLTMGAKEIKKRIDGTPLERCLTNTYEWLFPHKPAIEIVAEPLKTIENISLISSIPEPWHGDEFFSAYKCSLSGKPIRFILSHTTTKDIHYYEKEAILKHLKIHQSSPVTKQHMRESDLKPVPELQQLIDERVRHYLALTGQMPKFQEKKG